MLTSYNKVCNLITKSYTSQTLSLCILLSPSSKWVVASPQKIKLKFLCIFSLNPPQMSIKIHSGRPCRGRRRNLVHHPRVVEPSAGRLAPWALDLENITYGKSRSPTPNFLPAPLHCVAISDLSSCG